MLLITTVSFAMPHLTGRQLKAILNEHEDLKTFTRKLYALFAKTNLDRRTYSRSLEDRRLDAFARLLVGNETCAAVAFDGEHIIISTNQESHPGGVVDFEHEMEFLPPLTGEIYLPRGIPIRSKISTTGTMIYSSYRPGKLPNGTAAAFSSSGIVFTSNGDILFYPTVQAIGIDGRPAAFPNEAVEEGKEPIVVLPNQYETINIDSLSQRVRVLLKHLSYVTTYTGTDEIELYNSREKVLGYSLIYETLKLYPNADPNEIAYFVTYINRYFWDFTRKYPNADYAKIKEWWGAIIEDLENKRIKKPDFIKDAYEDEETKGIALRLCEEHKGDEEYAALAKQIREGKLRDIQDDKFIKFAFQYFVDLKKLEDYFREGKGRLVSLLSQQHSPKMEDLAIILDEDEEGIHAEMRVFLYLLERLSPGIPISAIPYIATSKLCCAHCNLVMALLGIKTNGRQRNIFSPWPLAEKIRTNENIVEKLLGKLYPEYCRLKGEKITSPSGIQGWSGNAEPTKADAVWLILQSLGALGDKDLQRLDIAKQQLRSSKRVIPDESDNEDGEYFDDTIDSEASGTGYHKIGNCLFDAIAEITGIDGVELRRRAVRHIKGDAELRNLIEAAIDARDERDFLVIVTGDEVMYESFGRYIYLMGQDQTWGTNTELMALARNLRRSVRVYHYDEHRLLYVEEIPSRAFIETGGPIELDLTDNHYTAHAATISEGKLQQYKQYVEEAIFNGMLTIGIIRSMLEPIKK